MKESGLEYIDASHVGLIDVRVFLDCSNLREVVLGDTYLENDTFCNCAIEEILYAGSIYVNAWFEMYAPGAKLIRYELDK